MQRISSWLPLGFCLLIATFVDASAARGQVLLAPQTDLPARSYPVREYYLALELYREGDLRGALEGFETALRRGRKDPSGLWIDAIPSHALLGECYYQSGNLQLAHENFDAAISLMLKYDGWLGALRWPGALMPAGGVARRGEWYPGPRMPRAAIPEGVPLMTGTLNASSVLQQGGALSSPQMMRIDVAEVLRGLALCLYRRVDVLGPLAVDDPQLERLVAALQQTGLGGVTWPRPWVDIPIAMALIADDQADQAAGLLSRSLQLQGNLDHPLAPLAQVALGRLMVRAGRADQGRAVLMNGSVSADAWGQGEMVAEAFRQATGPAAAHAREDLYPIAVTAAEALARRSRLALSQCLVSAAELAVVMGRPDEAGRRLDDLDRAVSRRRVALPRIEAQAAYVRALLAATSGNQAAAGTAAQLAIAFGTGQNGRVAAPRLYQIAAVRSAIISGSLGGRGGDELLGRLLERPDAAMWSSDAVEALAVEAADLTAAHMTRLELAISRSQADEVVRRVDRLTRHGFRLAQPLGGRVLDVRWTVTSPVDWLAGEAAELRQTLPGRFAELNRLAIENAATRDALAQMPLTAAGADAARRQAEESFRARSERLETLAAEIALRRQPLATAFPPPLEASSLEDQIGDGEAVLAYAPVGNGLLGILLTGREVRTWRVEDAASLPAQIRRLLAEIGAVRRRGGTARIGSREAWAPLCASLARDLLPIADDSVFEEIERLVVVPFGPLWQLPFELLPGPGGARWVDRFRLTYAPTLGLAVRRPPSQVVGSRVAGFSNRFFLPQQAERDAELVEQLLAAAPDSVLLEGDQALPGRWLSPRVAALWVASTSTPDARAPLDWNPLRYDRQVAGGSLADWMRFPAGAPQVVALPGVELGGQSPFTLICGFHAAGVPVVVMSRWSVGGASTAGLLADFFGELPHAPASASWQRAVLLLRNRELDPEMEPALSSGDASDDPLRGEAPLFWAGYLPIGGLGT